MGEWSLISNKVFTNTMHLLIEPLMQKQDYLKKLAETYHNFKYYNFLLSDPIKNVDFYEMETGSSIYQEQSTVPRKKTKRITDTLGSVIKNINIIQNYFFKALCTRSRNGCIKRSV